VTAPATLSYPVGVAIRGTRYPVVLPTMRDPRLHLAAVIVSLQVIGQVALDFRLSIAQILISIGTCAALEMAIVLRRQRMLAWPASALLTGNGVAFVLRVPGTEHGDWWSLHGAWIFAATGTVALLSKHLVRVRGRHVFNPSNIGLVVCFLALGPARADPLDFWWGPLSVSLALALALILAGGVVILSRLQLLAMAVSFWVTFVAALGVVAATGHAMSAKWHLGPIAGLRFWMVLATSPEILVFLFFMLTDPKTVPTGRRARVFFAVSVALLAALLLAPARTEFWAKVAVVCALAIVCAARPALAALAPSLRPRRVAVLAAAGAVAYVGALVAGGLQARPTPVPPRTAASMTQLPRLAIAASHGVDAKLDPQTAIQIVSDLQRRPLPVASVRHVTLWLEATSGQGPIAVVRLEGTRVATVEVRQSRSGYSIARIRR
jgi:Na+-translocating ferredoxin:NAD+ oxidoreductase RnfD subunit